MCTVHGRHSGGGAELGLSSNHGPGRACVPLAVWWWVVWIASLLLCHRRETEPDRGWLAAQGDQQAADDASVVCGRSVSDCASKALQAGGTGEGWLQCAAHCRLSYDCVLSDTVTSTVQCRLSSQESLLCGSCVVMRQQGNAGGGVAVWWNTTMRSDKSANSSSLLGCCEVMPSMDWTKPINRSTDHSQSICGPSNARAQHESAPSTGGVGGAPQRSHGWPC